MIKGNYNLHKVYIDGCELDIKAARNLHDYADDVLWGYSGNGPSMLSLALLFYFGATDKEALEWHQSFKREIVAKLPDLDFEMDDSKVIKWLEDRKLFAREFNE